MMSTTLNSIIIIATIILTILQELVMVRAIIVERNLHAYYKLPVNPEEYSQEYHILQCPYRNTTAIPTPENMDICVIVNAYREKVKNATTTARTKKTPLHTKVKYQMTRRYRENPKRFGKIRKIRPYMIVIRPVRMKTESSCVLVAKALAQQQQQAPSYHEHLGIVKKDNSRTLDHRTALNNQNPTDQRMVDTKLTHVFAKVTPITENANEEENTDEEDSKKEDAVAKESNEMSSPKSSYEEFTDYDTRVLGEKNLPGNSVLRYLGAQAAIRKLGQRHAKDQPTNEHAERFFEESNNYQGGEKLQGFQNYYHRDEIFNDHIFYDDLQQHGHYTDRGRRHESN
ncbi:uncharacterized protein LOC105213187 [Zeugodacus cucurbitae]|uniref:uncharacterized protein LOC105213187 n=1 Tax=Zeugodacus cucurbitae TaxID=28588 RepID=UPI000596838A|nr:uncharacterized protein LOC105213187 [Zeugodacus cucurbitae]